MYRDFDCRIQRQSGQRLNRCADNYSSGVNVDLAKFKKVPSTWVRVVSQGEPGFALIEQVRYIDRSRCKRQTGQLLDFDLKQVEDKLKQLLFP